MAKKGIALVIVLGFIFLLIIAATSFLLVSTTEIRTVRRQNNSTRALYLAEAGLHRARFDLSEDADWADGAINGVTYNLADVDSEGFYLLQYSSATRTALGGEFIVRLDDIAGEPNEIWVKSRGTYDNAVRTIKARVKSMGSFGGLPITSAIEAEGPITTSGAATVDGNQRENSTTAINSAVSSGNTTISVDETISIGGDDDRYFQATDTVAIDMGTGVEETGKIDSVDDTNDDITLESGVSYDHVSGATVDRILSFEDIIGMNEADTKEIAQDFSPEYAKYYDGAFTNNVATGLTWVEAPGTESQITVNEWTGDGVLVVNGDLKITGGTFNGVIWVMGTLSISGNPDIFGGIFAQGGVTMDTTITGTAEITFSQDAVDDAFDALDAIPSILDWQEVR
jgi:hypothetical protein